MNAWKDLWKIMDGLFSCCFCLFVLTEKHFDLTFRRFSVFSK